MSHDDLRSLIRQVIVEVTVKDVQDRHDVKGSTHTMQTGVIDGDVHYIKFSDEWSFDEGVDPSLQPLVEYLAYALYTLYGVRVPKNIHLVFDVEEEAVGIATSRVQGSMALKSASPMMIASHISAGAYVDIFLANWDVVGTDDGNIIYDRDVDEMVRIDPGGSLTFRAQGGRKSSNFSSQPSELETMFDPEKSGTGHVFKHVDLKKAAERFLSVSLNDVIQRCEAVNSEITSELTTHGLMSLLDQWNSDYTEIMQKLPYRWKTITAHAKMNVA